MKGQLDKPPSAQILTNSANRRAQTAERNEGIDNAIEAVRGDLYFCAAGIVGALERRTGRLIFAAWTAGLVVGASLVFLLYAIGGIEISR